MNSALTTPAEGSGSTAEDTKEDASVTEEKESSWQGLLVNVATMLVITVGLIAAYHFAFVAPNKQKIAMVDVAEIISLKELQVTAAAVNPNATDKQRSEAFEEIGKFARDVQAAVNDIQNECGCTLLVRAAVVKSSAAEDLTGALKERLGMAGLDQAALVQMIRASGGAGQPPMLSNIPLGDKQLLSGGKK